MIKVKKYIWKTRILLITTPSYKDKNYIKIKNIYQKKIKKFHKHYIKKIVNLNNKGKFNIDLIGFDGRLKKNYKSINLRKIFFDINKMPLRELINKKKFNPLNLSLFSDYNPKTTTHGLGFKDKKKALFTIENIKKRPIKYQVNVISTMLGRAQNHPNKTNGMNEAIKIFNNWMIKYKKSKSNF